MNSSTLPSGLFGVINFISILWVRSPQQRNENLPNFVRKLTLDELSDGSSSGGLKSLANGFGSPTFGMTSRLAVTIFSDSGVLPDFSGSMSPALSVFDLFCEAAR